MKPDNVTGSGQGTGARQDKTQLTEHRAGRRNDTTAQGSPGRRRREPGEDELHDDHRDSGAVEFEAGMEAPGNTAPAIRHRNRPERDKAGGNYNGPRRGRE